MPEFLWKWRREIIFTLLIAISIGILVSQRSPGVLTRTLHQSMSFVMVPFQKVTTLVFKRSRAWMTQSVSVKKLRFENEELTRRLEKLTLKNNFLQAQARENEALRSELRYKQRVNWSFLPTEIIARDPVSWLQRAVGDRGTQDGVGIGAGVISPEGVVGRISEADLYSSSVMFILDSQSSVAGVVIRSNISGMVKGYGQEKLKLMYVASDDDVKVGDAVVTSKLSSLFPPGVPIGDVIRVAPSENGIMLDIDVKPNVTFKTLERFLILTKEE